MKTLPVPDFLKPTEIGALNAPTRDIPSDRNVGTSSSKAKGRAIDAEKEEKIRKAQELAKNAKPGSLTSKANLVNKYNSGVKTEEVIPEKQDNKKKK